jgi:hypothetical protein
MIKENRRRTMPRWPVKREVSETVVVAHEQDKVVVVDKAEKTKEDKRRFIPYTGKESLPPYKVLSKGHPEKGIPDRIEYGEPRFVAVKGERKTLKVLAFYASPRGVIRKLYSVVKYDSKNQKARALIASLKECGIPGAF